MTSPTDYEGDQLPGGQRGPMGSSNVSTKEKPTPIRAHTRKVAVGSWRQLSTRALHRNTSLFYCVSNGLTQIAFRPLVRDDLHVTALGYGKASQGEAIEVLVGNVDTLRGNEQRNSGDETCPTRFNIYFVLLPNRWALLTLFWSDTNFPLREQQLECMYDAVRQNGVRPIPDCPCSIAVSAKYAGFGGVCHAPSPRPMKADFGLFHIVSTGDVNASSVDPNVP